MSAVNTLDCDEPLECVFGCPLDPAVGIEREALQNIGRGGGVLCDCESHHAVLALSEATKKLRRRFWVRRYASAHIRICVAGEALHDVGRRGSIAASALTN